MSKNIFNIKLKDEIKEVEGVLVEVYPWLKTFVHKGLEDKGHRWIICELSTGLKIGSGDTRKGAILNAKINVDNFELKKGEGATLKKISENEILNVHNELRKVINNNTIDIKLKQTKLDI